MPAPAGVRSAEELYGYGSAFAEYEAFAAALDHSLAPRGSSLLFDLVAGLGLPAGSLAVDVGAREAVHCIELARVAHPRRDQEAAPYTNLKPANDCHGDRVRHVHYTVQL
jgi:hypothetical protein